MSSKKLEIFRLGRNGEIHRSIICLGGRVTVFRANRENLLEEFRVALQARVSNSQFRIAVDGKKFSSAEHIFIGFDEQFDPTDGLTVAALLAMFGVSGTELGKVLENFDLSGLEAARVADLSPVQQRIVRMLAATGRPTGQVIVLNDPFESLSAELQERLSMRIADFAFQHSAIIVITRLSTRPETWIENPLIVRVQLERPRRATIGAGSVMDLEGMEGFFERPQVAPATPQGRELTQPQIPPEQEHRTRNQASQVKPAISEKPVSSAQLPKIAVGKKRKKTLTTEKPFTMALAGAYILVIAAIPWLFGKQAAKPKPAPQPVQVAVATPLPTPTPVPFGFQGLPQGIQDQVTMAFRDPDGLLRSIPVNLKKKSSGIESRPRAEQRPVASEPQEAPTPYRFFSDPTASAYSPPPPSTPDTSMNQEDLERRREEIRQRLLQAIMLRRQQMMQQQMAQ